MKKCVNKILSCALSSLLLCNMNGAIAFGKKDSHGMSDFAKVLCGVGVGLVPITTAVMIASVLSSNKDKDNNINTNKNINANLANAGNTCYFDSLLQMLYSNESFREFIENCDLGCVDSDITKSKIVALRNLFGKMKIEKLVSKECMTDFFKKFTGERIPFGGGQHDIHEAYMRSFEDVIDMYCRSKGINPNGRESGILVSITDEHNVERQVPFSGAVAPISALSVESYHSVQDFIGGMTVHQGNVIDNDVSELLTVPNKDAMFSLFINRYAGVVGGGGWGNYNAVESTNSLEGVFDDVEFNGRRYALDSVAYYDGTGGSGHYYVYKLGPDGKWYEYNDLYKKVSYVEMTDNLKENIKQHCTMLNFKEVK